MDFLVDSSIFLVSTFDLSNTLSASLIISCITLLTCEKVFLSSLSSAFSMPSAVNSVVLSAALSFCLRPSAIGPCGALFIACSKLLPSCSVARSCLLNPNMPLNPSFMVSNQLAAFSAASKVLFNSLILLVKPLKLFDTATILSAVIAPLNFSMVICAVLVVSSKPSSALSNFLTSLSFLLNNEFNTS